MNNPILPGDQIIEAHCTKCRENTHHTIITMDEGVPAKVQCQDCKRRHKYRPPKTAKTAAERRCSHQLEDERKEWKTLQPSMDIARAAAYSMTAYYKVGGLINHPLFGLGRVERIVGLRKIEVLFEDGKKTMRCK